MNPHVRLCEPLCDLLRGGAASLPRRRISGRFWQIFGGFSGSAEDENRGRRKALALFRTYARSRQPQCGLPRGFAEF